jgi:hypothetical protein
MQGKQEMPMADDDPQQVTGVVEGEVLVDKYCVEKVLGVGGMGVVVAARHMQLDTSVAIKILLPGMVGNLEAIARFGREARAAIEMRGEHVARIYDVGTLPTGAPYIVMELLQGADLRKVLDEQGPLSVEDAVDFVVQACEAVAEAHGLGIVHRDLKPANLFCVHRPDGQRAIKVLDFGISKVTGPMWSPPVEPLTVAAAVMGTPSYMSPEQLEAPHTVDSRTDVWALGVILYELLTGKAPFEGSTLPQVSVRIAIRPPPPVRELRPNIPPGLAAAIDTCLEKERERRYPRVIDLATALLPFGSRRSRISVNRLVENAAAEESPAARALLVSAPRPARRIARKAVPVLLGLGAVVLLFRGWLAPHLRGPREAPPVRSAVAAKAIHIEPLALQMGTVPAMSVTHVAVGSALPAIIAEQEPAARHDRLVARSPRRGDGSRRRDPDSRAAGTPSLPAGAAAAGDQSAAGASSCDPPFELDDQGRKHFKPECWPRSGAASPVRAVNDANCDPSYTLDDQGRKHFKPECFTNSKR